MLGFLLSAFLPLPVPRLGRYVFTGDPANGLSGDDQPWSRSAVRYWWEQIRREAGVEDVQIRDLRRTCASWLAMDGASTVMIQNVLNHSSLAVTQVYARLDQSAVRAVLTRHAERLLA